MALQGPHEDNKQAVFTSLSTAPDASCHVPRARAQAVHSHKRDSDTYDIYLLPPGEDVETCTSWLRMRNRDGRYNLMFEEWVTDGPFVISPRITFEVGGVTYLCAESWLWCAWGALGLARSGRVLLPPF